MRVQLYAEPLLGKKEKVQHQREKKENKRERMKKRCQCEPQPPTRNRKQLRGAALECPLRAKPQERFGIGAGSVGFPTTTQHVRQNPRPLPSRGGGRGPDPSHIWSRATAPITRAYEQTPRETEERKRGVLITSRASIESRASIREGGTTYASKCGDVNAGG